MCVMKPSKVLGMVATMVTVLLMSFPILSAPQSRGTQCDGVEHKAELDRPLEIKNADCPWNNHSPLIKLESTKDDATKLCYLGGGGGGGGVLPSILA